MSRPMQQGALTIPRFALVKKLSFSQIIASGNQTTPPFEYDLFRTKITVRAVWKDLWLPGKTICSETKNKC